MSFKTREEMQELLNELTSPELAETRRVEIITEIGQQHASGLSEYEETQVKLETTEASLGDSRDAMAKMYNQINASTFGGASGQEPETSIQETITLDDLLEGKE